VDTNTQDLLVTLDHLQMTARMVVKHVLSGMHSSRQKGASIEFYGHKIYTPLDDTRRMDWKAYAKKEKYYIKEFQHDARLDVYIICDHSGSMNYERAPFSSKRLCTQALVASLAWLGLSQGDAVGFIMTGNQQAPQLVQAKQGLSHWDVLVHLMLQQQWAGKAQLSQAIEHLLVQTKRPVLCFVVSDFFDSDPRVYEHLAMLKAQRFDVRCIQITHQDELEFPFSAPYFFKSMEENKSLFMNAQSLQSQVTAKLKTMRQQLQQTLNRLGISYGTCVPHLDLATQLSHLLAQA